MNLQESTKPLLLLNNVTFMSKIGNRILDGISLKLYEAERIALVCEKSSGKDFLILLIMTLLQRSEIPALGQSSYEILGKPVTLGSSSELRKNITFLSAKPTLLTGTVRQNVDPFSRFDDEEIMRVLHFLKIIKVLQEYSGMSKCEDIELFLQFKQGKIILNELYLDEMKVKVQEELKKKETTAVKTKETKKSTKPGYSSTLRSTMDLQRMRQGTDPNANKLGSSLGRERLPPISTSRAPNEQKSIMMSQPADGEDEKDKSGLEEGSEEENKQETEQAAQKKAGIESQDLIKSLNRYITKIDFEVLDPTDKEGFMKRNRTILFELKRILEGSVTRNPEVEALKKFFEDQFISEFPIPMPIPERAKRLDEDLEDFDGDYSNHEIHFEDERDLLKKFLSMEVGQNGKHLNEDTRKIIMMARAYLEKPPILFIDEEATYVTGVNRTFYLKQIFTNLREAGILSISKDLRQLHLYSNVAIVRQGKVIEQGPPLDLIDSKKSLLYSIVLQDDIRTLRQLEHKLEKNIRKFETMQSMQRRKKLNADKESLDKNTAQMVESGSVTPQVKESSHVRTPSGNFSSLQAQASKNNKRHFTMLKLLANDNEGGEEEQDDDEEMDQQNRSQSQIGHIEIPLINTKEPSQNYLTPHMLPLSTSKSTPQFLKSA